MKVNILTLFPGMFSNFLDFSIIKNAIEKAELNVNLINIRDYAKGKHNKVDDYPFGGGAGMIMKPEPIYYALKSIKNNEDLPLIYFTPQGNLLNQTAVHKYCSKKELILLCGHYKGIDHRIRQNFVDEEISIGDYVLSGGELPAMVFIDAITRLQFNVLGNIESALNDSHQDGILGCPQYTRPRDFLGLKVPQILLSGNHKKIEEWRQHKSIEITKRNRPDLLDE